MSEAPDPTTEGACVGVTVADEEPEFVSAIPLEDDDADDPALGASPPVPAAGAEVPELGWSAADDEPWACSFGPDEPADDPEADAEGFTAIGDDLLPSSSLGAALGGDGGAGTSFEGELAAVEGLDGTTTGSTPTKGRAAPETVPGGADGTNTDIQHPRSQR